MISRIQILAQKVEETKVNISIAKEERREKQQILHEKLKIKENHLLQQLSVRCKRRNDLFMCRIWRLKE
jgi:hypothetical protein